MAEKKKAITSEIIRFRARIAFVKLIEPTAYDGKGKPRWEATFLLDPSDAKHMEGIKLAIKTAASVAQQTWGVVPLELRRIAARFIPGAAAPEASTPDDGIKLAFYDGTRKDYDGFKGMFVIPAHEYADIGKPAVAGRNGKNVLPGAKDFPYSGCYVIGAISIWGQDNTHAKRLGINLVGVQFEHDGESFSGMGDRDAEEVFQALEDAPGGSADDGLGF
jgi:hypothetical protein